MKDNISLYIQIMTKKEEKKEEYNSWPVWYCNRCMSLNIKQIPNIEDSEYCDQCGSTDIQIALLPEWEKLYIKKYGKKLINKIKLKVAEKAQENNGIAYEELQKRLIMLSEEYNKVVNQARGLTQKINELQLYNAFKRLEFLFKVIEYQEEFSSEFVENVIAEIEDMLTIKQVNNTEEDEEA